MSQIDYTGKNLGGFRVLRKLGQGGMAVVYKAHEESLNRVVALKVIAQHLSDNPQFITRFQREAQAAAQLSHPNIVQIYAIGEDDGVHYFAMEYVKGRSLGDIIEEEGFLTAGRALPIIEQAAEALAVAHDAGIVHRDIKPANIMLDEAGRVKVADFGIAQMSTETRMTQSGMLVGTPEYISPEQCHAEKLDGRSDIYALGVTLYQLLSGRTPFNADTPAALVLQIVEGPVPQVGELNPTIPSDVQEIVRKMMHTDRNQRFQSAEDLLAAIKDADTRPMTGVHSRPVAAAPVSEPTEALPPGEETELTPPPAAPTEVTPPPVAAETEVTPPPLPATEVTPPPAAASEPLPPTAAEPAPTVADSEPETSAPTSPAAAAVRSTPATEARAATTEKWSPWLGIAAAVVVVVVLALLAWQFLPALGGGITVDNASTASVPVGEAAAGNQAAPGDETAGEDATEAASGEDPGQPAETAMGDEGTDDDATATEAAAGAEPEATEPGAGQAQAPAQQAEAQQQPPPAAAAQPQPEEPEVTFVPPPVNSIVAATSGEYEYIDLVGAWVEGVFGDQSFEVVDFPASPYPTVEQAARFLVTTTATLVSVQELAYYGNVQRQFTVGLTMRVTDLADGVTVVGPSSATVQYTAVNMQQNLERATSDLARRMARQLRQRIQVP